MLVAGAVHLGQVGVHLAEGWPIAGFFVVVGVIQLAASALLLWPRPRPWFWLGMAGSAIVIAIWAVSRTVGLPFVGEGEPEVLGVADGFASLAEAWTILVLGLYLAEPLTGPRHTAFGMAAALVLGVGLLWLAAAGSGAFNEDPARLAASQPILIDWLVAAAGAGVAGSVLLAASAPHRAASLRGLARGLFVATAVSFAALFWLSLPPTIGQNLDCQYAPLSTVLPGGHELEPEPVILEAGEARILPVLELRACGDETEVAVERIQPLTVMGDGATVDGFWLLPTGTDLDESATADLPGGAVTVPPGDRIKAGESRLLVVRVVGTGAGDYLLGSVRLRYQTGDANSVGFGTSIAVCSGRCDEE